MISNVDLIKSRAVTPEIIEKVSGVQFRRNGRNMQCISPFNPSEKTPSFVYSNDKDIWKCFSSGHGGSDAVSFVMKYRNCTFPEAIEEVAAIIGEVVTYDSISREDYIKKAKEERSAKEIMINALKKAHDFYKSNAPENEFDTVELAGKVYSKTMIEKWGIVQAGGSSLLADASKTWTERQSLIDAGLLKPSNHGDGYYDFFNNRVLFPLYDNYHNLIGYNGRIMTIDASKKAPKYINSPDTILYKKGDHIYGYVQNWRNIADKNLALLMEGPTDVIMLDQNGVNNAVSSGGTALTYTQAKELAKITDQVILVADGDEAGQKSILKNIPTLVKCQLDAKVKILPAEHDPGSYIIEHGADAFKSLAVYDGIEYLVKKDLPEGKASSPIQKTTALMTFVKLVSEIKNPNTRDQYCQTLAKTLDTTTAVLKSAVKDELQAREDNASRLTKEQEAQKAQWGLYIDNNQYYDYVGNEISNFVIRPLFLASYQEQANRIFEITNKFGNSEIINMNSDDFITLMGFRRATEKLGAFIFRGNDAQYIKIREWVYHDMKTVKPIEVLGYQPRTGIYAWANGITMPGTSTFMEVDEYGLVNYKPEDGKEITYFLPAESKVNIMQEEDNDRELELNFRYSVPPSGSKAPKSLQEYANTFKKVFKLNGAIGLCYILSAVHRDFLHARYDMFPHLNLFGPAGSGKTFMAQIMTGLFGKPMRAVHLVSSSPVAFYRKIAQIRNAIIWYEEYSEKVSPDKQEALKNFADGFGRITGQMTNNTKTKATPVLSACIISGQILPSHDPALLERCITLFFDKFYGTKKEQEIGEDFKEWTKNGYFSFVTAEIFSYRHHIERNFQEKMETCRDVIRHILEKNKPSDRVLNNFAMIAAIYLLIAEKVKLPYSEEEIYYIIVERIKDQSNAVEGADELSGFWKVLEYLIEANIQKPGTGISKDHYAVEMHKSVKVRIDRDNTETIEFEEIQKLLFIRLNYVHSAYMKEGKSMVSRVVEKGTLLHYMKQHKSYIGEVNGKRINGKPQKCLVFNAEYITQQDFELTSYKGIEDEIKNGENYDPKEGIKFQSKDDEFPF